MCVIVCVGRRGGGEGVCVCCGGEWSQNLEILIIEGGVQINVGSVFL